MAVKPKYAAVKSALKRDLRNRLSVGEKLPSTVDLQRQFRVSQGTINRAIQDLVNEGLVERRVGSGTFVSNPTKQSVSNVGVLWGVWNARIQKSTAYSAAVLHAIEEEAYGLNSHLVVGDIRDEARLPFLSDPAKLVSGLIVLFNYQERIVTSYHEEGIPVVLVNPFVRAPGTPFVTCDDYSTMRLAVSHLAGLGHRRIVHITAGLPVPCVALEERIFGYTATMQELGLGNECHVHRIAMKQTEAPKSLESGSIAAQMFDQEAAQGFFEMLSQVGPTACCCLDDDLAAWIISLCHEAGIGVPDQLSVVGVNDDELTSRVWPPLTTVKLPLEGLGKTAVRMLSSAITEQSLKGGGEVLPVRLISRASTKALAK